MSEREKNDWNAFWLKYEIQIDLCGALTEIS